ncbi:mannitol-1-phosphate 5-dehydrogenase [Brevibacillus sp. SYP-B805]|uniref:mannitol-1-phosphate 5-dehydrogenase n=1 Tax=Brevibacillus sp. SYP-B805 TaxID=1578199 RepID=UPI0013EB08CD|nr:mannitol-1-phosphate 5-dehydrogenase [Brevibacillus sp. SYP-B805]NGQ95225.1 mannitol-1-phosphate 5-dehydrogenase [Brevibacillus sp. SYP-B805]
MLAVHFGAGNIGRGFIGQLLHQAGYEVCFIDVNKDLVDEINRQKAYVIRLAEEGEKTITVTGIGAIHGQDEEEVAKAIARADLVTTAVGPHILRHIAPVIAKGIARRAQENQQPLNVIACENMIGGSTQLKSHVFALLSDREQEWAERLVGFPDAAVDRIVPLQKHEDPLMVTVEPYHEWVVNRAQIKGDVPAIDGVTFVDDLTPYIERKLFTVNTGHAMIAYLGYVRGYETIAQAIRDESVYWAARGALEESGAMLVAKHGFDHTEHEHYIQKILSRFENPYISDEVTRVGRSPLRKLSPDDRLVGPARQALAYHIQPTHLAMGIAAALQFDYPEDQEARELAASIRDQGIEHTITTYMGIPQDSPLFGLIMNQWKDLQSNKG